MVEKGYPVSEIEVTMTELRQDLGHLVNRAAYGGARIVLVAHGQPKAAIVGFDDLARLKRLEDEAADEHEKARQALTLADLTGERIRDWQASYGIEPEDSVEVLRRLREARDDELSGLR
jgi:prevent-host-death family protein